MERLGEGRRLGVVLSEGIVASLYVPVEDPNATKMPAVVRTGTPSGWRAIFSSANLNFILPFGLLVIGLKFMLRICASSRVT